MKILLFRSGGIGDVLLSTPLIRVLKKQYPDASISYLCGRWSAGVLENNPHVSEVIPVDDSVFFRFFSRLRLIPLIFKIRKKRFDMVFILDKSWHFGLLARFFGIPVRVGFDRYGEGKWNTKNAQYTGESYEGDMYLQLAQAIGISVPKKYSLEMFSSKDERKNVERFLREKGLAGKELIGIAPGGAVNPGQKALFKRWPLESYRELISQLQKKKRVFLIFGGKNDEKVAEALTHSGLIDCTGFSFGETYELMKRCRVVVTHDSGPLHIAAASGTKVIALFGPTPAKRFAPKNAVVIESDVKGCPCYDVYGRFGDRAGACMSRISISSVLQAFLGIRFF